MAQVPPPDKPPKQFIEQIYEQINDLFGQSDNALLQMEVPGRVLEKGTYDYEGSEGKDAMQRKPETVVDAEFRLSDDVFSLSHLVAGPKGPKVNHRVRRYVGYVDIESASEILLAAKENLRSSVFRSIDDSQDAWPVNFTPANWAKYLSTDFQPQDLLASEDTVLAQIFDKEKERALLLSERNNIKAAEQDIPALEAAEDLARRAFSDAQDKIYAQWADSTVQVVKLYFKAKGNNSASKDPSKSGLGSAGELNSSLEKNGQPPISDKDFDELKDNFKKGVEAESKLQLASESLSHAQLAAASARGKDKTLVLNQLDEQIQSLGLDIEYLRRTLDASANATGGKVPPSITLPSQEQGASLWEDVVINLKSSRVFDSSFDSSTVSRLDWSVNLFFGSASGSESSSESASSGYHTSHNTNIDIGFRAMKVEIGRPWFDAGIFQRSSEYYHLVDSKTKISPAPGPLRKALGDVNGDRNNATIIANANACLLPSWPTAFIIVKDVHIIMRSQDKFEHNEVTDMRKSMDAGGGILFFRVSKSSSSSEHRASSALSFDEKSVSIKIPGPQIIGWLSEFAPEDKTQPVYKSIGTRELEFLKKGPSPNNV
ncbi:hypothetical protein L873DRAFT_1703486 [Choiromyces venosus 120613-1]|uniref:Uncharacterized protein n=1 Tax=Choiromyces venosus 120613-1 TaxID=1336337 RepID=A0A3N4JJ61_9PEZI|nr:hypothetical protein L873DRAFT_1703486 [Choiromyces venosus 120613-1]